MCAIPLATALRGNHSAAFHWLNASANWFNADGAPLCPAAHVMLGTRFTRFTSTKVQNLTPKLAGTRYRDGQGLPKDPAKAYYHFDKAAKAGEVEVLSLLALLVQKYTY